MYKEFTRDMLDTYHLIKQRNGRFGVIFKRPNNDLMVSYFNNGSLSGWDSVNDIFDEHLKYYHVHYWDPFGDKTPTRFPDRDIIAIYEIPGSAFQYLNDFESLIKLAVLVWEREEEKKEMTISEIEEKLGYPIKIVKE